MIIKGLCGRNKFILLRIFVSRSLTNTWPTNPAAALVAVVTCQYTVQVVSPHFPGEMPPQMSRMAITDQVR